ncbi:MAG: hypothetical protein WC249_02760 [Patescibacteria group bacterium]|jgi:hypothetical protein
MSKNGDYLTAYFLGKEVNVINGYKSPSRGFIVEIFSDEDGDENKNIPTQSVSVWKLNHENATSAETFFKKIFGIPYGAAKRFDKKKGVNTKSKFLVEIKKDYLEEFSKIEIPKGEHIPEDVVLFAMAISINHGVA